jgi:hypothetical protein
MMDWQRELDALIESTIALAKDVKPKPISNLAPVIRTAEQALAHKSKLIPLPAANTPMTWPRSERDEILQRVSNFRAHQKKNGPGARGLLFASESQDAGGYRS